MLQHKIHFHKTFSEWVLSRKEIITLRENLKSLPKSGLFFRDLVTEEEAEPKQRSRSQEHILMRQGVVLSSRSILKLDRIPPLKTKMQIELDVLAPYYRKLKFYPISGVAQPTIDEMKA